MDIRLAPKESALQHETSWMAGPDEKKKRSLPPKVASMRAKKRRKLNGEPAKSGALENGTQKTKVNADSFAWKAVSMPDHLDDYEGFFGLEEVGGVDVVRDPETGGISFVAVSSGQSEANGEDKLELAADDTDEVDGNDEEWSGFDDHGDEHLESSSGPVKGNTKTMSQKEGQDHDRMKATSRKNVSKSSQPNGNFMKLESGDDEIAADLDAWKSLRLSPDTMAALRNLKFSTPTPIQQSAIPEILAGHDVIGKASTGSGKTLAFGIPILESYLELQGTSASRPQEDNKSPLALILSPTRELAHQLDKHLTALCSNGLFESPSVATLTGGLSVQKQQRLLKHADIVIGTPGRLWEVISEGQGIIRALKGIKFLVVDEADRLLSEGHFKEVEEILDALDREEEGKDGVVHNERKANVRDSKIKQPSRKPPNRQTLVFSATFNKSLQRKLAGKGKPGNDLTQNKESLEWLISKLNFHEPKPKFIDVNPINQLATGLKESLIECAGMEKDLYLYTLLLLHPSTRTLVFANSVAAVRRLTPFLQNMNLDVLGLHSGMPQKARLRAVERFKAEKSGDSATKGCGVLVATDVAARGLDIPDVQLVIHYHLPRAADMYVHRSGRTARAGMEGSSILICAPEEVAGVRRLVAKVHANSAIAESGGGGGRQGGYYIRTLDLDRRVISRLKPRAVLAKKIADTTIAKEKRHKEDDFLRSAAEELGVDYDSESFGAEAAKGKKARGSGRKKKEKAAAGLGKAEVAGMKAELKGLLKQRVNVGVSEKYLTSGSVDIDDLLRQRETSGKDFLGSVQGVGLLED